MMVQESNICRLQKRAEEAAKRFPKAARKPIVIEFAGVPKAGKTSTINHVQAFLKRCGFKTEIVIERASICPIKDKKHANFNVWTACTTLAQILEKTQTPPRPEDPQILILDRGIFDSLCWIRMMEKLKRLRGDERKIIQNFLEIDDWRKRISGVILMTVSADESMKREQGLLPVKGGKGSIMNRDVLEQMVNVCENTSEALKEKYRIFKIDTSKNGKASTMEKTAEKAADHVLNLIEEHLEEDILSLPKEYIKKAFSGERTIRGKPAKALIDSFHEKGDFSPRSQVESNLKRVQALPIVVVRNVNGDILRLKRKESDSSNPLHEKIVIWAGGHVRQEDSDKDGKSIPVCAVREIEEELRLRLEVSSLTLLGAIYIDEGTSTRKHVAIVYEWRARKKEVDIALSNAEFFERRGNSLSGKFVPMEEITDDIINDKDKKASEPWSYTIIDSFLTNNNSDLPPKLI